MNAKRSDSVVPTKSTEYEEAVKSVQEWNEALRSPNPNCLRKPVRSAYTSPRQSQRAASHTRQSSSRESLPSVNTKVADKYRSPENEDDIWDDDFASAVSPSALQFPRLKPQDNFGGMLSSEKLKAFASLENIAELGSDRFAEQNSSNKDRNTFSDSDPQQTIRPYVRKVPEDQQAAPKLPRRTRHRHVPTPSFKKSAIVSPIPRDSPKPASQPRPAAFYKESSVEDYSDLIAANEEVLESKLAVVPVSCVL